MWTYLIVGLGTDGGVLQRVVADLHLPHIGLLQHKLSELPRLFHPEGSQRGPGSYALLTYLQAMPGPAQILWMTDPEGCTAGNIPHMQAVSNPFILFTP